MPVTAHDVSHGLVRPWHRGRSFALESRAPQPTLAHLIDRFWMVRWDLRNREPFRQEILPHPSINLVIEPDGARVWGVPTRRDARVLHGQGWALGTKFQPGAFTAITGLEAHAITNSSLPVTALLHQDLDPALFADPNDALELAVAEIETRLAPGADIDDPNLELVAAVIATMRDLAPDARAKEIAAKHYIAPRTLQRLFRRYVGVSPKWVLKRLRIHDAAQRLATGHEVPWTTLALDLGYYDHAHFIRDFRLIVGRSPAAYATEARAAQHAARPSAA